jgi:hypothetical protein
MVILFISSLEVRKHESAITIEFAGELYYITSQGRKMQGSDTVLRIKPQSD